MIPGDDQDVRQRLLGGLRWTIVNVGTVQVVRTIAGIILVRLLSPRDYGLAGMALVFSSLVLTLSDLSMGAALVQRREITEADRSTVFWTSATIGVALALIGLALSGPLADFYGQPAVRPLFAAVSLSFFLVALQTTQHSVLQREMRFRALNLRLAGGVVIGSVVGIVAAVFGAGPWALIAQQISMAGSGTILLWISSSWRPHFLFSWKSLRDLGGYGLNLLGSNLVGYIRGNADNILVGRFLGSAALGSYAVAYNLMFRPVGALIVPIQETAFPAFAHWQDDTEQLGGVWLRLVRVVAAVLAPAMLGFIVVTPDFVDLVLGRNWRAAVPVLQILAVAALAYCVAQLGQRVLGALDQTRFILRFATLESVLTVAAFVLGLRYGLVGVAIAYTLVSVPLQLLYVALTARALDMRPLTVAQNLAGVAASTATTTVACVLLRATLVSSHVVVALRFPLVVAAGIITYVAASRVLNPHLIGEIRSVRSRRFGSRAMTAATR